MIKGRGEKTKHKNIFLKINFKNWEIEIQDQKTK